MSFQRTNQRIATTGEIVNATQMIDLMNQVPFQPLEIHLADGAKIRVEPYHIAVRRNSPTCIVFESDDKTRHVAFRNITEVVVTTATE